jgi:hypothetical protein
MKLKSLGLAIGMAGALVAGSQAQAASILVIDDFNVAPSAIAVDATANGVGVSVPAGGGGLVGIPGWARGSAFTTLTAGDRVETVFCAVCGQAHFNNNANSNGHGAWDWAGPAFNAAGYNTFAIDYSTDVPGGDLVVTFTNGGAVVGQIWWMDLPDTNGALGILAVPIAIGVITDFHIDGFSVGGAYNPQGDAAYTGPVVARNLGAAATSLDLVLDNPRFIPEPATLALLGLGLVALGARFRRGF